MGWNHVSINPLIRISRRIGRKNQLKTLVRCFQVNSAEYKEHYGRSVDPKTREDFWADASKGISWYKPFDKVLDLSRGKEFPAWFPGGKLNLCFNAVDRHVFNGKQNPAFIYESQPLKLRKEFSFEEVQIKVARLARTLRDHGVAKGDRVVIYMPMVPEALISMLACARLGAVHSVVFGGFAAKELAARIDDAKPKAVITASHGFEPHRAIHYEPLLAQALELVSEQPHSVISKNREGSGINSHGDHIRKVFGGKVIDMDEILNEDIPLEKCPECEPLDSSDPSYIIYTSGTTGKPKGIVRDTGGYAVMLSQSMQHFMGCETGGNDVYFAGSDIGWVVGHSYIVYGPLINGTTAIFYEGKPISVDYPYLDNSHQNSKQIAPMWDIVARNKVTKLFVAPTALRAVRRADQNLEDLSEVDISSLQTIYVAGERADPDTVNFFHDKLKLPIVDNYWQTETGSPICGYQTEAGLKSGSCGLPTPGFEMTLQENDAVCVKLPLPPGCLQTIYKDDERYLSSYLSEVPGFYFTGDSGHVDENGYISVMSRTGDMINTAGHRLSTGALEEVISAHDEVVECAVIGMKDSLKGFVPLAFVVLHQANPEEATIQRVEKEINKKVMEDVGHIARLKKVVAVSALPKTRSGKILRAVLQKQAHGEKVDVPPTIEDASVLELVQKQIEHQL